MRLTEHVDRSQPASAVVAVAAERTNSAIWSTPSEVTWGNSVLLPDDPAAAIRELKAESGGDIMTSGSGTAVRWLLSEGLVDELRLLLYPVVAGTGKRLFPAEGPNFPLTLRPPRPSATASSS